MATGSRLRKAIAKPARAAAKPTTTAEDRNVALWYNAGNGKPLDFSQFFLPASKRASGLPPLAEVPLDYATTSPVVEPTGKRSRLHAIIGVGATLDGLAAVVTQLYSQIPQVTHPDLELRTVSRALAAFLQDVLPVVGFESLWQAGLRVPLPIEIDLSPGTPQLVLHGDTMLAWSALAYAVAVPEALLVRPAAPLPIIDPDPVPPSDKQGDNMPTVGQVAIVHNILHPDGAPATDPRTLVANLSARLLRNPYEPVFEFIELCRQLRDEDAAAHATVANSRELALMLPFADQPGWRVDTDGSDPLRILGWTSAGQAVLRRLWLRLGTITDPNTLGADDRPRLTKLRQRLAFALDLATVNGAVVGPPDYAPGVQAARVEPPLLGRLSELPAELAKALAGKLTINYWRGHEVEPGNHAMALGRFLRVGAIDKVGPWSGPAHPGSKSPRAFCAAHPEILRQPDGTVPAAADLALKIILAIGPNEGNLDAARAADSGLISTGMQQWTNAANNEMTVLLEHYKSLEPYHFDLFFGLFGLDTRVWGATGSWDGYEATLDPTVPADLVAIGNCNVYWSGQQHCDLGINLPTYVALDQIAEPGQRRAPLPIDPRIHGKPAATQPGATAVQTQRVRFFGGQISGGQIRFGWGWPARFRIVSLCSVPYNISQVQTAVFRMQRMVDEAGPVTISGALPGQRPKTGARASWTLPELCNSEWSAAIALDAHINRPELVHSSYPGEGGTVPGDLQQAVERTNRRPLPAYRQDASGSTDDLDDAWHNRWVLNFLALRHVYLAGKRARDGTLADRYDDPLDPTFATAQYPQSHGRPIPVPAHRP